jgi:hypothetical protein
MKGAFVTLSVTKAPFIARLRSHWLALHTLHEAHHLLLDIRRQLT